MFIFNFSVEYKIRTHLEKIRGGFCFARSVTIMLRNKNVTSKSCIVSKMIRIKIDTKRVECIMRDTYHA